MTIIADFLQSKGDGGFGKASSSRCFHRRVARRVFALHSPSPLPRGNKLTLPGVKKKTVSKVARGGVLCCLVLRVRIRQVILLLLILYPSNYSAGS